MRFTNLKHVMLITILLVCFLNNNPTTHFPYNSPKSSDAILETKGLIPKLYDSITNVAQPLPVSYNFEVPYYQQETSVWCGPAALKMVFDYYGPVINQSDIVCVAATDSAGTYTSDLVRASHFSYISIDSLTEQLHGYRQRQLGYATLTHHWSGTYSAIITSLKTLLHNNVPILILTYYDTSHNSGHFRVLTGYDDNAGTFLLHDPWYSGQYHGPNIEIGQSLLINDLWASYNRWGMVIQPWQIEISINTPTIIPGQVFILTAQIERPCPDPFVLTEFTPSNPQAELELPPGFAILGSESTKELLFTGGNAEISWAIQVPHILTASTIEVNVTAGGTISGTGYRTGDYTDVIGTESSFSVSANPGVSLVVIIGGFGSLAIAVTATVLVIIWRRQSRRLENNEGN
ncbi:MAG: C39 family peptidase [Promethearchaeota archaeon]